MGYVGLDHIEVSSLKRIEVDGGDVMHAIKKTDQSFAGFGEAYFSNIFDSHIKAWKLHSEMTMNLIVPLGRVRFVFAETAKLGNFIFRVEEIGEGCYCRITVPPGIWFGFQGRGGQNNLVLNISNVLHHPNEVERCAVGDIDFDWG